MSAPSLCPSRLLIRGRALVEETAYRVRTPLFPLYSEVRALLKIWPSVAKKAVLTLINALWEQNGTPQDPVDWTDPDTWIPERLTTENASLAQKIWQESGKQVHPRHVYGSYLFINSYELLFPDLHGDYQLSQRGEKFLAGDERIIQEIDEIEGLPQLLSILAPKSPAKRSDLLDEWGQFLKERSKFGAASTIKDTLWRRVRNLIERGFVERDGNSYAITEKGLRCAATTAKAQEDSKATTLKAINEFNAKQLSSFANSSRELGSINLRSSFEIS
jgi:restriction system protein